MLFAAVVFLFPEQQVTIKNFDLSDNCIPK
jgi:hypothetical protein